MRNVIGIILTTFIIICCDNSTLEKPNRLTAIKYQCYDGVTYIENGLGYSRTLTVMLDTNSKIIRCKVTND